MTAPVRSAKLTNPAEPTRQGLAGPGFSPTDRQRGGIIQRKCACGGTCEECKKKKKLQRKATGSAAGQTRPPLLHTDRTGDAVGALPAPVTKVLAAPGRALDTATRHYFESRFGHDFSRVRIHVDDAAAVSVHAHAFTSGKHIVFAGTRFQPGTPAGRHLLAHELTHVVQQESGADLPAGIGAADDRHEHHADAVAQRITAGHSVESMLPGRATTAQTRSPSPTIQREAGLLPPRKVAEVFGSWVIALTKARHTGMLNEALEKEARERTRKQVGPTNYANWERWEQAQQSKAEAQADAENPRPKEAKPFDPQGAMLRRYEEMSKASQSLNIEVVRMEHLAHKLNFGSGIKGSVARHTAGGYTALWGIGARSLNSALEHGPMLLLGAGGLVLGSELAERTLVKHGQAIKEEGGEMGDDARTAVRLVGGELQAAYEATRPSYNKFQKALSDFTDASVRFKKDIGLDGIGGYSAQSKDIADMEAAMKAMREASNDFLMACAKMGIETDAQALDKMGGHIVKASQDTVGTAVMMGLPEVAPGLREIRGAFKKAEGMGAKQLEKAAADKVAASVAKSGERAPAGVGRPAASAGERSALESNLPHGEAPGEAGMASSSSQAADAAAGGAKGLKRPAEAEAKQLKQLAKDKNAVKRVSDPTLKAEYDLEIEVNASGEKHTFRRKSSDGTWCRFSTRDCGYQFDPEDQEAINRMAAGEFSRSAGWAIEDYTTSLGYSKPKEGNFPGIDAWKGGKQIPKGTAGSTVDRVVGADVVQVKAMNSLRHGDIISQYNTGIEGLLQDSWQTSKLVVSKPNSRTLLMIFDEATYSRLSFGQELELKKLINTMTQMATKNGEPIVVKWLHFIGGRMVPIIP